MKKRLAPYNIPEPILSRWDEQFNGRLLPLQYRAIEDYRLLEGESVLISAPTSSGKTFCGEMALVRAVLQRKKGIFLVPLKAVAEEKYNRFRECYGEAGLKVVIGSRDHPEFDCDIENGRFDLAVMVYEKFNSLLLTNFDLMAQVGTVVIDELQMLEEENRGPRLELALTKMLYGCGRGRFQSQIIGLSSALGEAEDLAGWLGCRLLLDKVRPVELRRGVAVSGSFHYRCHNSGASGEEQIREGEDNNGTLFENLREGLDNGRQVLVFLKSRLETARAARQFAQYAGLEPREDCREFFDTQLEGQEESSLLANLKSLLNCGLAFHNADLTIDQRAVVEAGYRTGLIRVIFATTTLATGINLPAETVFIDAQKYRLQEYSGRPGLEPLSWSEYESMSGRAGRVGMMGNDRSAGRAILLAANELEKDILWDFYIDHRPRSIESLLDRLAPVDIVLDLFASELAKGPDEVDEVLRRSYYSIRNTPSLNVKREIYKEMVEDGFLCREHGGWIISPLGMATAVTGLSVADARFIRSLGGMLSGCDTRRIIYRLLHCPDVKRAVGLPSWFRRAMVNQSGDEMGGGRFMPDSDSLTAELAGLRRQLTSEELERYQTTNLMCDWMDGMSALDIENNYRLHPGMMENLARQIGWLLHAAAAVVKAGDPHSELPGRLDKVSFSASTGLPDHLREMHEEMGTVLYRNEILALESKGISSPADLLADPGAMDGVISSSSRRANIEHKLITIKESNMATTGAVSIGSMAWPHTIDIDGTQVRERFLVRINGHSVPLTGKSFKYLFRLVWSRLKSEAGWLYKEDLEQGFNQARYLYRLRQEIGRDFFPDWPLYENNRAGYYRLVARPEGIKVNLEALCDSPDYEIRRMAEDLAPSKTA